VSLSRASVFTAGRDLGANPVSTRRKAHSQAAFVRFRGVEIICFQLFSFFDRHEVPYDFQFVLCACCFLYVTQNPVTYPLHQWPFGCARFTVQRKWPLTVLHIEERNNNEARLNVHIMSECLKSFISLSKVPP